MPSDHLIAPYIFWLTSPFNPLHSGNNPVHFWLLVIQLDHDDQVGERCKTHDLENVKTVLPLGIFFCEVKIFCSHTKYFVQAEDCAEQFLHADSSKPPSEGKPPTVVGGGCLYAFGSSRMYSLSSPRNCSLSRSPDPVSPQPQSCFQVRCLLSPCPPGVWSPLKQDPRHSWWVLLSESSPANLAADSFSAVSLVSYQQLPVWVCILCLSSGTIRLRSDFHTRLQQVQKGHLVS